ncbi:MAG: hypothetical protein LBS45_01990, partial [Synergistaceae bacterium]|nr:hypothetical protein [Synergistaceae bacterium]
MGLAYHRKKSGAVYVYSVQNYWDKEKHAPRNKQVCLGRLDPESGEIIPSKRKLSIERAAEQAENENEAKMAPPVSASAKTAGPSLLLEQIAKQLEIEAILKKCF